MNIGNVAFHRYSRVFLRKEENEKFNLPVSIVTDLDIKEDETVSYDVIKLTDDLSDLSKYSDRGWEISSIKGMNFENEDRCFEYLKNISSKSRLENGMKKELKSKMSIKKVDIEAYRSILREKRTGSFDKKNIKSFINQKWTLEYDIACSDLKEYLLLSILKAKGNDEVTLDEVRKTIEEWENSGENVAKKIFVENFYKELSSNKKSSLSKAIVAQYFAQNLIKHKGDVKTILEEDEYLSYIKGAIDHACGESIA